MARKLDAAALARLRKRFEAIPERMRAKAKVEVENEANAMVEEMKRGAPVDDGDLQASIRATDLSTDTWIRWKVSAGGEKTRKPVRNSAKGNAPFYDYALGVEHGTSDTPAQPFFYPTHRRRRKRFRARLARELKKAAKEP
ncbi:MAG: HK97-gp10 family putative phage morphogenesis protein [Brevundimonas sp.]